MAGTNITLDQALDLTRTGDIWLFRGRKMADRAIRVTTNSPVNHVGMSVVLDDLPPLMWHAELGRSLPDLWSGVHQRGVQLHDMRSAVLVWCTKYGQRAWLRQLDQPVDRAMEDAVLRTIARLDGTPFPSTARLAGRWLRGRVPRVRGRLTHVTQVGDRLSQLGHWFPRVGGRSTPDGDRIPGVGGRSTQNGDRRSAAYDTPLLLGRGDDEASPTVSLETAYCAEVIAVTYEAMGLLPLGRRSSWYDAGRFWSGDDLRLSRDARLGGEIAVEIPPAAGVPGQS